MLEKLSTYFGYRAISTIKIKVIKTSDTNLMLEQKTVTKHKKAKTLSNDELTAITGNINDINLKKTLTSLAKSCFFTGT